MRLAARPARLARSSLAVVVLVALALVACVRRDVARETAPLHVDLREYWTCAVVFATDGRGENANEPFTFVPWLETRIREQGVFEPLERRDAKEAEITVRVDATGDDENVLLRILLLDTKTKAELGEFEANGVPPPAPAAKATKPGDDDPAPAATETKRTLALRGAADRILEVLKEKRRLASLQPKKTTPPPPPDLPDNTVAGGAICSTQCLVPAAAHATHDDMYRVSAGVDPTLRALRACLDRVGGQLVVPAVLLRFGPDGRLRHVRVDVGGYEELECIQNVRARPVRASTSRATILRCEHRCTTT